MLSDILDAGKSLLGGLGGSAGGSATRRKLIGPCCNGSVWGEDCIDRATGRPNREVAPQRCAARGAAITPVMPPPAKFSGPEWEPVYPRDYNGPRAQSSSPSQSNAPDILSSLGDVLGELLGGTSTTTASGNSSGSGTYSIVPRQTSTGGSASAQTIWTPTNLAIIAAAAVALVIIARK